MASLWFFGSGQAAVAQAPLPGERPLDALQFKGSHNSYDRPPANDRQISEYNCWAMEFDLNWDGSDNGAYRRGIWVAHSCPVAGLKDLRTELRDTFNAAFFTNRVTIFNLEMKNNGSNCTDWGEWPPTPNDPANSVDLIKERIDLALADVGLSFNNVYTPADFTNNASLWPSWQEIVRRGKCLIIVLQTSGLDPNGLLLEGRHINPWFFNAVSNPALWTSNAYNYAFVNTNRAGTNGITASVSPHSIDRWIWRSWPSGVDDAWPAAVERGFNEIASNNIDSLYTNDGADVHSSQPLFVNRASSLTEWGTYYRPYNTFTEAYNRASPAVDVYITNGSYNERITLAKPMRLHSLGGMVRIGAP